MDNVDAHRPLNIYEQRIKALNRQLEIEMKIKTGAENMLQTFSQGPKKDKKLCEDAQAMLKDAKLKIDYIKMQLNKNQNLYNESISSSNHRSQEETLCELDFVIFKIFYFKKINCLNSNIFK